MKKLFNIHRLTARFGGYIRDHFFFDEFCFVFGATGLLFLTIDFDALFICTGSKDFFYANSDLWTALDTLVIAEAPKVPEEAYHSSN